MNQNTIGNLLQKLRKEKNVTQKEFAEKIGVSDKTVSKWETGKGYPDITILESIAAFFDISLVELFSGVATRNGNVSCNIAKAGFYVCPVCGNILFSTGGGTVCCCGITLRQEPVQKADEGHKASIQTVDGENFLTFSHPMTKEHYLSFIVYLSFDTMQIKKLYPEGNAEGYFPRGKGIFLAYCNQHKLFRVL